MSSTLPAPPASLPSIPATRPTSESPPASRIPPPPPRDDRTTTGSNGGGSKSRRRDEDERGGGGGAGTGGGRGRDDDGRGSSSRDDRRGGNRRRSRSPSYDDRRNSRRRSMSPRRSGGYGDSRGDYGGGRGSYRDERDDFHYDDHSRFNRGMDPPESLPYEVTLRYYTDYLKESDPLVTPTMIETMWKKYKTFVVRKGLHLFFDQIKGQAWFEERYEGGRERDEVRSRLKVEGREGKMESWLEKRQEVQVSYDEEQVVDEAPVIDSGDVEMKDADAITDVAAPSTDTPAPTATSELPLTEVTIQAAPNQLFIKSIPPDVSRQSLEDICSKIPEYTHLVLSDPNPLKRNERVGWIQFRAGADLPAAIKLLDNHRMENDFILRVEITQETTGKILVAPPLTNIPERIAVDLQNVREVALAMEKRVGDTRGSVVLEAQHEAELGEEPTTELVQVTNKKTLDRYLYYLRSVHNTCYYCLATYDFTEELERRCAKHVRGRVDSGKKSTVNNDTMWTTNLENKLPLLLDRSLLDPVDFGGDSYDEELHRACRSAIKHEEEGKFRCKECNKLFSALKFIEKHLSTKHPEALGDSMEELEFFNNYVLDPTHLLPAEPARPTPRSPRPIASNDRPLADRMSDRLDDNPRRAGARREEARRGPPLPPPKGAVMDPRSRRGASSYADLDGAPAGAADSVMLQY